MIKINKYSNIIKPYLTIGIPTYNSEKTLISTLESCINLPAEEVKIIVSDNCSTDRTFEIAKEYSKRQKNIIVLQHSNNIGATNNFNYLLENCLTELFMWLGSDDVIESVNLNEITQLLDQYPNAICIAPFAKVGEYGEEVNDRGNRNLVKNLNINIIKFLLSPGVNSRFYSIYRTNKLKEIYIGKFDGKNGSYYAADIVFSVNVLSMGEWPMSTNFKITRKPGISADGWKLRKIYSKTLMGAIFPSMKFIILIVQIMEKKYKIPVFLITLILYIRYLVGPIRHRINIFMKKYLKI